MLSYKVRLNTIVKCLCNSPLLLIKASLDLCINGLSECLGILDSFNGLLIKVWEDTFFCKSCGNGGEDVRRSTTTLGSGIFLSTLVIFLTTYALWCIIISKHIVWVHLSSVFFLFLFTTFIIRCLRWRCFLV